MKSYTFIRSVEFNHFFEIFVISAIASIITIRFYLQLTGFPQIATGDLHIAHMLWGGLLLTIAMLGSLTFLDHDLKSVWAAIGGAGFGTFIDEIGKFVTKDNNYFFQPTFAIIYVIFVFLYILYRLLVGKRQFSEQEYLVNSVEKLKEAITNELDTNDIKKAIQYLSLSEQHNPITIFLKDTFTQISELPLRSPSIYSRMKRLSTMLYVSLISKSWFIHVLSAFFVFKAIEYFYIGGSFIYQLSQESFTEIISSIVEMKGTLPVIYVGSLFLQAVFIVIGVWYIRTSRVRAYKYFKYSVLISLLILQVFNFYNSPVVALFATIRDVLLFTILDYIIVKERSL